MKNNESYHCSLVAIFIFIYRYKKNKPQIDAFIAKEKEKDLIKDKRRATKRRKWALAIGDIVARRNGLSVNGFTLDLKLTDDKRQQLALQVKQELGTETYQSNEDFRQQIGVILQRWATGLGNSPHDFYEQLAAQGGFWMGWRLTVCALLFNSLHRRFRLVR